MGYRVVESSPVGECVAPYVSAEKVLAVDRSGDIAEDGLNVSFDGDLPLLVWCRTLVAALVVLVICRALGGAESREIVTAEDAWAESSGGEEA